jgi:hypothetical protein
MFYHFSRSSEKMVSRLGLNKREEAHALAIVSPPPPQPLAIIAPETQRQSACLGCWAMWTKKVK